MKFYHVYAEEFGYPVYVFAANAKHAKAAAERIFPEGTTIIACVDRTKHSAVVVDYVENKFQSLFADGNLSKEVYTFVRAAIAEYREKLKKLNK